MTAAKALKQLQKKQHPNGSAHRSVYRHQCLLIHQEEATIDILTRATGSGRGQRKDRYHFPGVTGSPVLDQTVTARDVPNCEDETLANHKSIIIVSFNFGKPTASSVHSYLSLSLTIRSIGYGTTATNNHKETSFFRQIWQTEKYERNFCLSSSTATSADLFFSFFDSRKFNRQQFTTSNTGRFRRIIIHNLFSIVHTI